MEKDSNTINITERFNGDDFCYEVARIIRPEIGKGYETYLTQGRAYLSNCTKFEVVRNNKTNKDKFDVSFSITCHYAKKELYDSSNKKWFEMNDRFNVYQFPSVYVVARNELNLPPGVIIKSMLKVFKADVLVLGSYTGSVSKEEFKKQLGHNLITVIYLEEISIQKS